VLRPERREASLVSRAASTSVRGWGDIHPLVFRLTCLSGGVLFGWQKRGWGWRWVCAEGGAGHMMVGCVVEVAAMVKTIGASYELIMCSTRGT